MEEAKQCTVCNEIKPLTEFRFRHKQKRILQTQCKTCCKQQGKDHYEANKSAQIAKQVVRNIRNKNKYYEFKSILYCVSCSESASYCLEFHHLDSSTKEYNVGNMGRLPWNTVKKELSKCICLCSNCHRKVHYGDMQINDDWLIGPHSLMEKVLVFETS